MINTIRLIFAFLLAATSLASAKDWGSMSEPERARWIFSAAQSYCVGGEMIDSKVRSPADLTALEHAQLAVAPKSMVIAEIQKNCAIGPTQPNRASR